MASGTKRPAAPDFMMLFESGTVAGCPDSVLLDRFLSEGGPASDQAFATLVERHGPMVWRVCRDVLREPSDADDAFQATFLILAHRSAAIRKRSTIGPWLYGVALRIARSARRRSARRRDREHLAARPERQDFGADEARLEEATILHEEVARLGEKYRTPVVLCHFEGLTHDQAAGQLGWPVGTVRSRLARGRDRLRSRLARRGLAPEAEARRVAVPPALAAATSRAAVRFAEGKVINGIVADSIHELIMGGLRIQMATRFMMATLALGCAATAALAFPHLRADEAPKQIKAAEVVTELPVPEAVEAPASHRSARAFTLAISPDGKTLGVSNFDGTLKLLDASMGDTRFTVQTSERGFARVMGFMPDGQAIAGVCDDNHLRLWEAGSGKLARTLPGLRELEGMGTSPCLNALAISTDGALIAIGGGATTDEKSVIRGDDTSIYEIRVVDAKSGKLVWSHVGRRGFMHQLAFSPDNATLASASLSEIRLWDSRSGELKQTLSSSTGSVYGLAFSPDSKLLAYGTTSGPLQRECLTISDLRTGNVLHALDVGPNPHSINPGTVAFSPDGKTVAGACSEMFEGRISVRGRNVGLGSKLINRVKLWDVATGALIWTSPEGDLGHVSSLVFSPDGESLFCCDMAATSRIDARTGRERRDLMLSSD